MEWTEEVCYRPETGRRASGFIIFFGFTGQVVVIGATNRPDAVDPALRRPGRFDREFYFPLPNREARRKIIDIHTSGWQPPIEESFKDELAGMTKGYGGADLRALCTEAALNAVQRRYPQIYKSKERLLINPESIDVTARDFVISAKSLHPFLAQMENHQRAG
jgi:SpoVK/Ycf46/Vps4 family AAA+-type ATPase